VIRILKNLGGVDSGNWNGTDDDTIYYINPNTKLIDVHSLVVFNKEDIVELNKFWKMTVEDFDAQFPFKENDIVELILDTSDKIFSKRKYIIVSVRWDHVLDEVEYGLAEYKPDTIFGKPEIFRNADEIRYYDESTDYESMGSLIVPDKPKTEILLFSLSEYKVEVDGNFIKVIKK
jgi:hypothetical protein